MPKVLLPSERKRNPVTVWLEDDLEAKLGRHLQKASVSRSAFMRAAITEKMRRDARRKTTKKG